MTRLRERPPEPRAAAQRVGSWRPASRRSSRGRPGARAGPARPAARAAPPSAGEQRDERSGDPRRAQELLREDDQRGERRGDGQGAEGDGATGGRHRSPVGDLVAVATPELDPVAGEDEEAVVDRQPDAEPGDDLEREEVDVDDAGERVQQRQGERRSRSRAEDQRQRRRDRRAEDEEQQQQQDRRREQLDPPRVLLGLLADLVRGDRGAAGQRLGIGGERLARPARRPRTRPAPGAENPTMQRRLAVVGDSAPVLCSGPLTLATPSIAASRSAAADRRRSPAAARPQRRSRPGPATSGSDWAPGGRLVGARRRAPPPSPGRRCRTARPGRRLRRRERQREQHSQRPRRSTIARALT